MDFTILKGAIEKRINTHENFKFKIKPHIKSSMKTANVVVSNDFKQNVKKKRRIGMP